MGPSSNEHKNKRGVNLRRERGRRKKMAKANNKVAIFVNVALMVSLLLAINMAEGKLFGFGFAKSSTPSCDSVYGVQTNDTCFAVRQQFNLTTEEFNGINPNLNCDELFLGQWLCVDGTT